MKKTIATLCVAAGLAGCSSFPVGQYAPSDANRALLVKTAAMSEAVTVSEFTATKPNIKSISCRAAGNVTFPNGQTPEQYLSSALRKELVYAGRHADNGAVKISGNVNQFDFNSNIGAAGWDYDVTVSNGADSFRVNFNHRVKTAWIAERACAAVAEQFVVATQEFVKQVLTHPKFVVWTAKSPDSASK